MPESKWQYIDDNWPQEWIPECKAKTTAFWEAEYKPRGTTGRTQSLQATKSTQNSFEQWQQSKQRSQLDIDEYDKYLQAPVLPEVQDARTWLLEATQRSTYPNPSIMAIDILSIPAMSAEPERLFSGAKTTITDRRNNLGIESIQAVECLKSWLGLGCVA